MIFSVIKEFLYLLRGFFRDINHFCFTLYREGEIVTIRRDLQKLAKENNCTCCIAR